MTSLLDVEPYALRFWEEEFPILEPHVNAAGRKVYTERDLETIRRIRELLYDERYTIPGARQRLMADYRGESTAVSADSELDRPPALGTEGQVLIRAAGDKGGGAAIHLDAALDSARRIEQALDRADPQAGITTVESR